MNDQGEVESEPSDPINRLKNGPRYPFTESPRNHIGRDVRSGVYAIWRGEDLIYAGFAGRDGARGGFVNRLLHHRRGDRSGDKFCVYVFDRYILPELNAIQITSAAAGRLKLDPLIREFVANQLKYSYVPCENQTEALELEARVLRGELGARPSLNSTRGDDGSPDEHDDSIVEDEGDVQVGDDPGIPGDGGGVAEGGAPEA